MIYVNSIQVMLLPVIFILLISYYIKFIVDVDNFSVNSIDHKLIKSFDGALKLNDELSKADILFEKEGVISAVKLDDQLYLGTTNGRILKYNAKNNQFDTINQFNAKITSIRLSEDHKNLYLLSVCTGIFKLDLLTRRLMLVYDHNAKERFLNPSNATHLNDFVVLSDGSFLIAQSSRRWTSRKLYYSHLEADQTGQLIKYTPKTDKIEILKKNLAFPKGLELSDDKKSVLVSEFISRSILRFYLDGPKKYELETVLDNLPGEPNHIRRSELNKQSTYWIAINSARNSTNYGNLDLINNNKIVKEIILYLIKGVEDLFLIFSRFIDSDYWLWKWNNYILNLYLKDFKHGLIIEIDSNGKILNSLHSPDGRFANIEEVNEINLNKENNIYLTSAYNQFIAKL